MHDEGHPSPGMFMRGPLFKAFRCAALITLSLLSVCIQGSQAALASPLPDPLLTQGTLLPEEADGPFQYWGARKKYFLVVTVNQTGVPKTELPFAQVDGQQGEAPLRGSGINRSTPLIRC